MLTAEEFYERSSVVFTGEEFPADIEKKAFHLMQSYVEYVGV